MTSTTYEKTWEIYTQSWSEMDAIKRLELFGHCLTNDCVYTDPLMQTTGYEQLSEYMSELQRNVPGVSFVTTDFISHHGHSLAHWMMLDGNGNTLLQGASFGLYAVDGRLIQMTGFYEPPGAS